MLGRGMVLEGDRGENVEADKSCERQADDDGDEIDSGAAEAVVLEGSGHDDSFVWVELRFELRTWAKERPTYRGKR